MHEGDINNIYRVSDKINEIDIKAKAIQFELIYSNSIEHIEIEIQNFYSNDDLKYEVNTGRLSISAIEAKKIFGIAGKLILGLGNVPKLIVRLPSNYTFEKFRFYSKAADSKVDHIYAKFVFIENDVGQIDIKKIEAEYVDITNNKGKIDISELKNTGNIKAINNVGEISIHLVNIENYNYNGRNKFGSIKISNEMSKVNGTLKIDKGFSQTLDVENNVGSVSVF